MIKMRRASIFMSFLTCFAFSMILFSNHVIFHAEQRGVSLEGGSEVGHIRKVSRLNRVRSNTYFIAVNFYNSAAVLKGFIPELVLLLNLLGPNRCYVSIWENGSTDGTVEILHAFELRLKEMGVRNSIVTETTSLEKLCEQSGADECHTPNMFKHGVRDSNAITRITMMAYFRNKPLQPLFKSFEKDVVKNSSNTLFPHAPLNRGTKVLFFNDIYFSHHDVVELIDTNKMNYDLACALDFENLKIYDLWVIRDIKGLVLHPRYPYFWDLDSYWKMLLGQPIQVYSCWNGLVAFDASVMNNKASTQPVRFRSWTDMEKRAPLPEKSKKMTEKENAVYEKNVFHFPECTASECHLFSKDLWDAGYNKIFVNPLVRVDYDSTQRYLRLILSPFINFATGCIWILKGPQYTAEYNENNDAANNKDVNIHTNVPPVNVRCGIDYVMEN